MKAMKCNNLWMSILALVALLVCSCQEKNGTDAPTFPSEVTSYSVEPGDTVVVAFTANVDWQLSSDAVWCKVDGFLDTTGKAGEQQVSFIISADGQSVDEHKANIKLRMGDESKVIAVVTRAGISNAIVLGNDSVDYIHGQTLVIDSEGVASLSIKDITFDANSLYITTTAEWLDIRRDDAVFTFTVKEEYRKYTQNSSADSVCFSNREIPMMRLNVQYTGMDSQKISISPDTQWGVTVSVDGATYRRPVLDGVAEELKAPMQVTVTALNDAYTFYYANYDNDNGCVLVNAAESWVMVKDDKKGNFEISFKENAGAERVGYLFVLPNAISEALTDANQVSDFLLEDSTGIAELKIECEQYLVAEFTQEDALAGCFSISYKNISNVAFSVETDSKWIELALEKGVESTKIYHAELEAYKYYMINPMLGVDIWDPSVIGGKARVEVCDKNNNPYAEDEYYSAEPALTEDNRYYYMQMCFFIENEEFIVYIVDSENRYLKALIVTPIISEDE